MTPFLGGKRKFGDITVEVNHTGADVPTNFVTMNMKDDLIVTNFTSFFEKARQNND